MNKLVSTILGVIFVSIGLAQPSVQVFSPDTFKDFPNVRDLTITSDQSEMYFSVQSRRQDFSAIMVSKKRGDSWGKPVVTSFSGQYKDIEPFLSEDGLTLYFASSRPVKGREDAKPNYDIWKVTRNSISSEWSEPMNLGAPVNTEADEFYPSIATSGNLYFTAEREGTTGKEDIFLARYENGKFTEPQSLPSEINSQGYEFNAFVSYDESYILFTGYGREDGLGGGDLYIGKKDNQGNWQKAEHLDVPVNSKGLDYCPYVYGGRLYFTSNRSDLKAAYDTPLSTSELIKEFNKIENGVSRIYSVSTEGLID